MSFFFLCCIGITSMWVSRTEQVLDKFFDHIHKVNVDIGRLNLSSPSSGTRLVYETGEVSFQFPCSFSLIIWLSLSLFYSHLLSYSLTVLEYFLSSCLNYLAIFNLLLTVLTHVSTFSWLNLWNRKIHNLICAIQTLKKIKIIFHNFTWEKLDSFKIIVEIAKK